MGCSGSADSLNDDSVDLSHLIMGSCIGKGGFGKVHAVLHKGTGVQMAMKRLAKNKVIQKQWQIDSVWSERNLLELCTSHYTNKLFFAFQTPWELFLVMPYLRGGDLGYYIATKGRLQLSDIRYYGAEILLGLKEMRRINVVYRDMKPENLIFNDSGHLVLTDFGICSRLRYDPNTGELTTISDKIGTPQYMAPEQLQGLPYRFEVDYFCYGLTLYEMFMGKRLFAKDRQVHNETVDFFERSIDSIGISDPHFSDLLKKILHPKGSERLGCNNIQDIMQHPFFVENQAVNWDLFLTLGQSDPPHKPDVSKVNAFSDTLTMEAFDDDPTDEKPPDASQQEAFALFEYNTTVKPEWTQYWAELNAGKSGREKEKTIDQLWNKPISPTAFQTPVSDKVSHRISQLDFEITRPVKLQVNKDELNAAIEEANEP